MTVLLTPSPNPDNRKEQRTLVAAVGVLSAGETLRILPGTWPGNVTFPSSVNLVGAGRNNTFLPGRLVFPGGGSITNLELTIVFVSGGLMTMRNVTVEESMTIQPAGGVTIPPSGNVVIQG